MSRYQCEAEDGPAPRVGCGCRKCYRAREESLDPRLMALARRRAVSISMVSPGSDVVYRGVLEYLSGRMDYGALHIAIIGGLVGVVDKYFNEVVAVSMRGDPVHFTSSRGDT